MRLTFGKTRPIIVKLLTALDSIYKLDSVLMEKKEMKLLVDIRKPAVVALRIWPTGPIMVQKLIVPACSMHFEIQSLDSFWLKTRS